MHKPSVRIYVGVFCLALLTACSEDKLPLACLPESELNQTVDVSGGDFKFGDNRYYPDEGPVKVTRVAGFNIDKTEVTNGQFKAFVDATDYVTAAERGLSDVDFRKYHRSLECQALWCLWPLI